MSSDNVALGIVLGIVLALPSFLLGRWVAAQECASGASRESIAGYVAACKARGGDPSARVWASPPQLTCTRSEDLHP